MFPLIPQRPDRLKTDRGPFTTLPRAYFQPQGRSTAGHGQGQDRPLKGQTAESHRRRGRGLGSSVPRVPRADIIPRRGERRGGVVVPNDHLVVARPSSSTLLPFPPRPEEDKHAQVRRSHLISRPAGWAGFSPKVVASRRCCICCTHGDFPAGQVFVANKHDTHTTHHGTRLSLTCQNANKTNPASPAAGWKRLPFPRRSWLEDGPRRRSGTITIERQTNDILRPPARFSRSFPHLSSHHHHEGPHPPPAAAGAGSPKAAAQSRRPRPTNDLPPRPANRSTCPFLSSRVDAAKTPEQRPLDLFLLGPAPLRCSTGPCLRYSHRRAGDIPVPSPQRRRHEGRVCILPSLP